MKKNIADIIYEDVSNFDINPMTKGFAKAVATDICNYLQREMEGKFVKGDFFLKTLTGYVSMNSLRKLK